MIMSERTDLAWDRVCKEATPLQVARARGHSKVISLLSDLADETKRRTLIQTLLAESQKYGLWAIPLRSGGNAPTKIYLFHPDFPVTKPPVLIQDEYIASLAGDDNVIFSGSAPATLLGVPLSAFAFSFPEDTSNDDTQPLLLSLTSSKLEYIPPKLCLYPFHFSRFLASLIVEPYF